jgi:XTP/dITP diphosphohydrolase
MAGTRLPLLASVGYRISGKTMARRFTEKKLVIASHNKGKIKEIAELLAPFGIEVFSAGELDLPEPEETEKTFIGNAQLKSTAAANGANLPALADDSGLAVSALDGAPGIYSARWAGPDKDFDMAMEKVQNGIGNHPDRRASFICALSLAWPDGHVENFEGRVEGEIVWPKRGAHGFGYDPIFQPNGFAETFGEMDPAKKHEMSHRADAFAQLVKACFED